MRENQSRHFLKVWQGSHCQPCDWGCPNIPSLKLVWPLPLAHIIKLGNLTCEHCFAMYVLIFWIAKYERKSCLNWMVSLQVLPCSQVIFPFKTWFFGIYFNFQWQKSITNQYLPHSESKSYQINSIKSCSSRSFQQHQRHIPIPLKPSVKKSFNIQELLHPKSKCQGTKPIHPPCPELSRDTKTWSKASWFSGSHNYKTKQTTFLHR